MGSEEQAAQHLVICEALGPASPPAQARPQPSAGEGAFSVLTQRITGPELKGPPALRMLATKVAPRVRKPRPLGLRAEPSAEERAGAGQQKPVWREKVSGARLWPAWGSARAPHPESQKTRRFLESGKFPLTPWPVATQPLSRHRLLPGLLLKLLHPAAAAAAQGHLGVATLWTERPDCCPSSERDSLGGAAPGALPTPPTLSPRRHGAAALG